MGLAPILVGQMFAIIRELHQSGTTTILLVEQNAEMALQVADRAYAGIQERSHSPAPAVSWLDPSSIKKAYLGG